MEPKRVNMGDEARRALRKRLRDENWLPDVEQLLVATLGALAVGALYMTLRTDLALGPSWLLLVIEAALLAPVVVTPLIFRRTLPHRLVRSLTFALIGILAAALVYSVIRFVEILPLYTTGGVLLRDGATLWIMNILVSAAWYWEIDGGGPRVRALLGHQAQDYLFPQQQNGNPTGWAPGFVDYLFLAFCFSTALSPADTVPLTRRAKTLMMAQALISIAVSVLLIGRAINILAPAKP